MKKMALAGLAVILAGSALAQGPAVGPATGPRFTLRTIERPAQPDAIPLYPAGSLREGPAPERWGVLAGTFPDGTRTEARIVRNVAVPTVTPVLPEPAKATGAAVIVAPGGAYLSLSIDREGFDVARWLAAHGIAAFVLKYRVNATPADNDAFMGVVGRTMARATATGSVPDIHEPRAVEDALQALTLIRKEAVHWHVDPARVGMIGFSAGARTTMQAVLNDRDRAGPAFIGYIYGAMTAEPVPANAPPMFAALALDDGLYGQQGFGIVDAWHKAKVPVELHAYERGDHGFGMGKPGTTSMLVMEEFRLWLASRGLLEGKH